MVLSCWLVPNLRQSTGHSKAPFRQLRHAGRKLAVRSAAGQRRERYLPLNDQVTMWAGTGSIPRTRGSCLQPSNVLQSSAPDCRAITRVNNLVNKGEHRERCCHRQPRSDGGRELWRSAEGCIRRRAGSTVIKAALERTSLEPDKIDEVILGHGYAAARSRRSVVCVPSRPDCPSRCRGISWTGAARPACKPFSTPA